MAKNWKKPVMLITYNKFQENINVNENTLHYAVNPSGKLTVNVAENGNYEAVFLFTKTADFNLTVNLLKENTNCDCNALYSLKSEDKVNFNLTVCHKSGKTNSNQTIKGIVNDKSFFNFCGIIDVEDTALKTDAKQLHLGMLLSDDAKILSSPQLMIRADDVKCSHGSAVGELDKEQLFYLTSRGIPELLAKEILINSFFTDILDKVKSGEIKADFYKDLKLNEPEL